MDFSAYLFRPSRHEEQIIREGLQQREVKKKRVCVGRNEQVKALLGELDQIGYDVEWGGEEEEEEEEGEDRRRRVWRERRELLLQGGREEEEEEEERELLWETRHAERKRVHKCKQLLRDAMVEREALVADLKMKVHFLEDGLLKKGREKRKGVKNGKNHKKEEEEEVECCVEVESIPEAVKRLLVMYGRSCGGDKDRKKQLFGLSAGSKKGKQGKSKASKKGEEGEEKKEKGVIESTVELLDPNVANVRDQSGQGGVRLGEHSDKEIRAMREESLLQCMEYEKVRDLVVRLSSMLALQRETLREEEQLQTRLGFAREEFYVAVNSLREEIRVCKGKTWTFEENGILQLSHLPRRDLNILIRQYKDKVKEKNEELIFVSKLSDELSTQNFLKRLLLKERGVTVQPDGTILDPLPERAIKRVAVVEDGSGDTTASGNRLLNNKDSQKIGNMKIGLVDDSTKRLRGAHAGGSGMLRYRLRDAVEGEDKRNLECLKAIPHLNGKAIFNLFPFTMQKNFANCQVNESPIQAFEKTKMKIIDYLNGSGKSPLGCKAFFKKESVVLPIASIGEDRKMVFLQRRVYIPKKSSSSNREKNVVKPSPVAENEHGCPIDATSQVVPETEKAVKLDISSTESAQTQVLSEAKTAVADALPKESTVDIASTPQVAGKKRRVSFSTFAEQVEIDPNDSVDNNMKSNISCVTVHDSKEGAPKTAVEISVKAEIENIATMDRESLQNEINETLGLGRDEMEEWNETQLGMVLSQMKGFVDVLSIYLLEYCEKKKRLEDDNKILCQKISEILKDSKMLIEVFRHGSVLNLMENLNTLPSGCSSMTGSQASLIDNGIANSEASWQSNISDVSPGIGDDRIKVPSDKRKSSTLSPGWWKPSKWIPSISSAASLSSLGRKKKPSSLKSLRSQTMANFSVTLKPKTRKDFRTWLNILRIMTAQQYGIPSTWRKQIWYILMTSNYVHHKYSKAFRQNNGKRIASGVSSRAGSLSNLSIEPVQFMDADSKVSNDIEQEQIMTGILRDVESVSTKGLCGSQIGKDKLSKVLLSYSLINQKVGYCHGFHHIGELALTLMDGSEEKALMVLSYLVDNVLPPGFYGDVKGATLEIDVIVFFQLLKKYIPDLHKVLCAFPRDRKHQHGHSSLSKADDKADVHLGTSPDDGLEDCDTSEWGKDSIDVEQEREEHFEESMSRITESASNYLLYDEVKEWFSMLFISQFPTDVVLKLWDGILLEGDEMLFRFGLGLLYTLKDDILSRVDSMGFKTRLRVADAIKPLLRERTLEGEGGVEMILRDMYKYAYEMMPFPFTEVEQLRNVYSTSLYI
eukprot:Nk52_evm17s553 gene=Nk52_evmTU17s553